MTDDYLPLSYLNHFEYCPRRFWYIYVQGQMVENAHVVRGNLNHAHVDQPGYATTDAGVTVHRRVYVVSHTLAITGICDLLEEDAAGVLTPVEYKQGRQGAWQNDQAQLCAQALCLEEMTGRSINRGAIFYFGSRRRIDVPLNAALRTHTQALIQAAHRALRAGHIPAHTAEPRRCQGCSLIEICLPRETQQLVAGRI